MIKVFVAANQILSVHDGQLLLSSSLIIHPLNNAIILSFIFAITGRFLFVYY